ncbi:MAG TPA: hypothetical protein VFR79_01690 [Nitrospira sp.]|nr:hypothetical protein [Nitrospira sp.]
MQRPPEKPFGRLEIVCTAGAVFLAVGSLLGQWPFNLSIALMLLGVVYWTLRDLRSLSRSHNAATPQHRSRKAHAKRTDQASR